MKQKVTSINLYIDTRHNDTIYWPDGPRRVQFCRGNGLGAYIRTYHNVSRASAARAADAVATMLRRRELV